MLAPRDELAAACRRLAAEGLVTGSSGNASLRLGSGYLVTPAGGVLADLTAADMVEIGAGGDALDPGGRPTSETPLHLAVYECHGAGAVVHTHSPVATAVGCVTDEVPAVHYGMAALGGPLRVAPYATYGTPELAAAVAGALDGRRAALMRNHGVVAQGRDLREAVEHAVFTEWVCRVWWTAQAVGPPAVLSTDQLAEVARRLAG